MRFPVRRDTARFILIDPDDRVLLFRHHLPAPWSCEGWLTPGGAIERGEAPSTAAARELCEETGHVVDPAEVGAAVGVTSGQWSLDSAAFVTTNWYFFACSATGTVDLSGQSDHERRGLLRHRWWTVADLNATRDLVLPVGLVDLVLRLLKGDLPGEPLRLPWS
jgi:ADP-ribose pyrophosphatase YjhB (NUDIX family)